MSIVHICNMDKFIPSFIDLVNEDFESSEHSFWLYGDLKRYSVNDIGNVKYLSGGKWAKIKNGLELLKEIKQCDKIILHSLPTPKIISLLLINPDVLKKCYWFVWGGDLYQYKLAKRNFKWYLREVVRRQAIKRLGNIVTYIKGDFELVREWYGNNGKLSECLMYKSNTYNKVEINEERSELSDKITILLGNSADPSNNHLSAFDKIEKFKNEDIEIITPLSYGIKEYAEMIIMEGEKRFGDKFKPITNFMPYDQYLKLLSNVNIAIFNHSRQQAMGNTISLLGLKKTVYLNKNTTQWTFFEEKGIHVLDVQDFSLKILSEDKRNINEEKIEDYFSIKNLTQQLKDIFNS
ncbi:MULTISPECIES: TDP-N-acetylfucosamine:lipid II N-acetylfucosaminyltransferase [unclassified Serratia (in: enterobacteria)]|uniref:TDP-N-acetylfucosamine:lipid II N-acetylfucosaminyltransferase n=1 Tax=unclassified Serratia (in: enterobacteria) TaxID=2647522 RepID=UPI0030767205